MEILRRKSRSKVYFQPFQGRYRESGTTHYDKEHIKEAMQILYDSREIIQNTIFEYCETLEPFTKDIKHNYTWERLLTKNIFPIFLRDHQEKFSKFASSKTNKAYPVAGHFFRDINNLLSGTNYNPNLRKLSFSPITRGDINKGWLAIIREYGLFGPASSRFFGLTQNIFSHSKKHLQSNELQEIIDKYFSPSSFQSQLIKCPARSHIRNYFAVCIATNIGLKKAGLYSNNSRINLLNLDEPHHFRRPEDIYTEYDAKIKSLAV